MFDRPAFGPTGLCLKHRIAESRGETVRRGGKPAKASLFEQEES